MVAFEQMIEILGIEEKEWRGEVRNFVGREGRNRTKVMS